MGISLDELWRVARGESKYTDWTMSQPTKTKKQPDHSSDTVQKLPELPQDLINTQVRHGY